MEKKQKSVFFKKHSAKVFVFLIVLFWSVLAFFGLLQKFDYRLYDLMLGMRPNPEERAELLFVEIDNDSLEAMGPWPWTRDILANALLRMRELGAAQVIFDVEYLSPSNLAVNPHATDEILSLFRSGDIQSYDALYDSVQASVYRDYDDFFARAIQFFGNTWLTINIADIGINPSAEERAYVAERHLRKDVEDVRNIIEKDNQFYTTDQGNPLGFAPALHQFMTRAQGAGFTNVVIDRDGTRRRVLLLNKQGDDGYVGQLSFAPLLHNLGVKKIIRHAHSIELVDALIPGAEVHKNIKIPVDAHGRMNINWLHKDFFDSFRHERVLSLADLDSMEANIVDCLASLNGFVLKDAAGNPLSYVTAAGSLLEAYDAVSEYKQVLLERCTGFDRDGKAVDGGGIAPDDYRDYFAARTAFFDGVQEFIAAMNDSYLDAILARLAAMESQLGREQVLEITEELGGIFDVLENDTNLYQQYSAEMRKNYADAICIVGNTASSTTDLGTTPFNRAYPNVGTHANVYNTVVNQDFIIPVEWWAGALFAAVLAFFYIFWTAGKQAWQQNLYGVLMVAVVVGIPMLCMITAGVYVPIVTPALIAITTFLVVTVLRFVTSEKDKSFLRSAFSTYLSPTVVDQIVKSPEKLRLGGEEKVMTALFSDIRSFSSFSEMVTPTKLVSVLNDYLGAMSDCILAQNGTIDKYIGDAIVSFFGAPIDLENHAYAAAVSAIRMKQAEKAYNDAHFTNGDIPMLLQTRIGLNSGEMVVGNMGTSNKMNYTMMGDNVNLASRLEGVNKAYHSWILASETTWQLADMGTHKGELVARPFDRVRVVGKEQPVQLYNILGFKSELSAAELESVDVFREAISLYLKQDFQKAGKLFLQANSIVPEDETPLVFAQRCKEYLSEKLPEDWDGVYQMKDKGHD